jgi:hypothetical protein
LRDFAFFLLNNFVENIHKFILPQRRREIHKPETTCCQLI